MKQANYDEKTEQVQIDSDSFEPLKEALSDGTGAIVNAGAKLTTTNAMGFGDISVLASDLMISNLISGGLAIGAAGAGVGVGLSVMVLFSDVEAVVEDGAALSAADNVNIIASSGKPATVSDNNAEIDTRTVGDATYYHYKDAKGDSYYYNPADGKLYRIDDSNTVTQLSENEDDRLQAEGLTLQTKGKEDPRGVDAMLVIALVAEKLGIRQDNSVFMVGVTGSGGAVAGVSVTLGALFVFSKVNAELLGDVISAKNVNVNAIMDFGNVVTATAGIAISAGAGISVSAGFTFFMGEITAAIRGNANVAATGTVSVTTGGTTKSSAGAAGVAGGTVGVGVNIALAVNTTLINTFISQGVTVHAQQVLVQSTFDTKGAAYLMTATVGGVAVGVGVAFVLGVTLSNVYIGKPADGALDEDERGTIYADTVTVTNDLSTDMYVAGVGLSVGAVAVDVIVALAFNYTEAAASINRMHMEAGNVLVRSSLHGGTEVVTTSLTAGGVAVGVSVALAFLRTNNNAFVNVTNSRIRANNLSVYAGDYDHPADSVALVTLVAGVGGLISVGVNFGIAINASANRAKIYGHVDPDALIVTGNMKSEAVSRARAFSISANVVWAAIGVNPSIAFALLISQQEAYIELTGAPVTVGSVDVVSKQNTGFRTSITDNFGASTLTGTGAPDQSIIFTSMAEAFIFSGAGGLLSVTPNIAFAIAAATGDARLSAPALTVTGLLNVQSFGSAIANVNIDNMPGAAIAVGVMVGSATAGGGFTATLVSGGNIHAGSINVETTYRGAANTIVIPASAGVSVSLCTGNVNAANSLVVTVASACITGTERGYVVTADGAVSVAVNGGVRAYATVGTPYFTIAAVLVSLNAVGAEALAEQTAEIKCVTLRAGSVSVESNLNNLNKNGKTDDGAFAELGKNSNMLTQMLDEGYDVPTVNFTVALSNRNDNVMLATNACKSTAAIYDASVDAENTLSVLADGVTRANASVTETASVGLISIGLTTSSATAAGAFKADIYDADIKATTVNVNNTYEAEAKAETMQPNGGVGARFAAASVTTNTAVAVVSVTAESLLYGRTNITADTVNVSITGLAKAFAGKLNPLATLSAIDIAACTFAATNKAFQKAGIEGATVEASAVNVTASFNSDGRNAAEALLAVPQNATSVSLVGVNVNTALAEVTAESHAYIEYASAPEPTVGYDLRATGTLSIESSGSAHAEARTMQGNTIGAALIGVTLVTAMANGTFYAGERIGNNRRIKAGKHNVSTTYTAHATATAAQTGAKVSGASAETNTAIASVGAGATAEIAGDGDGSGEADADGDGITVTVDGNANAVAGVYKAASLSLTTSAAMNALYATLEATQTAQIKDVTITGADAVEVKSFFNVNKTDAEAGTINATGGSYAYMNAGGSAAGGSITANVAKAEITAQSTAQIVNASIGNEMRRGRVLVHSYGASVAKAQFGSAASASYVGVGCNLMTANSNAKFTASIDIDTNGAIYAESVDVFTRYATESYAVTSDGSLSISVLGEKINSATAVAGSEAGAYLSGDGRLDTSGTLDGTSVGVRVRSKGDVRAEALYSKAGLNANVLEIATTVLSAKLEAKQYAVANLASLVTNDGGVVISAEYNVDRTKDDPSAEAYIIGAAHANVSFVGATAHSVTATDNSLVIARYNARLDAAGINSSMGTLSVTADGRSFALAGHKAAALAAGVSTIGIIKTYANARASFNAYAGADEGAIADIASLTVLTTYLIKAYAETGMPTYGVGAVDAAVNLAEATVGGNGDAYNASAGIYGGNGVGMLRIHGALDVRTARGVSDDGIDAYAIVTSSTMSVTGAKMGSNMATARLNIKLRAFVMGTNLTFDGAAPVVTVQSLYGESAQKRISSEASVGMAATGSGISLTLIEGAINTATAHSNVTNEAYISNATILTDDAVKVEAETWSLAHADSNQSITITGIAYGSLSATSYACDTTAAHITGAEVQAATVMIRAYGNTKSESNVGLPSGVSFLNVNSASARAYVGESGGSKRNTVLAYAGSGTTITASGNVSILAENRGRTEAKAESNDKNVSVVNVSNASLFGYAYLRTEARVDENAAIISGGNVNIYAKDYIYQKEHIGSSENIGILGLASNSYASNRANTIVKAVVKGSITAAGNVDVHTDSDAYQYSKTGETGRAVFYENGNIQAENTLVRDVDIEIGGDARISVDNGYIRILAQSGANDSIFVTAEAQSGAAFGTKDGTVTNTYTGSTDIAIGAGAVLFNRFGDIEIKTAAGHNYSRAELEMGADGVSGCAYADAYETVTIHAKVQIGGTGEVDAVRIEGRNVTILAGMGKLGISAYAKTFANGPATVDAYATAKANLTLTAALDVNKAVIRAYDDLCIKSDTTPTNKATNVSVYANSKAYGTFNANIVTHALVQGSGKSNLAINSGAELYGYHVSLEKANFAGAFSLTAISEQGSGFLWVDWEEDESNSFDTNASGSAFAIDSGAAIYIGRSVSGVYVEIAKDLTVRAVGVDKVGDEADGTQYVTVNTAARTLTIPAIQSGGPGSLVIKGSTQLLTAGVVRYASYTPFVDILNKSDYHIILGGVDVYDENAVNSSLTVNGRQYRSAGSVGNSAPHVSVTSEQGTDVTVNGLIANEKGEVTFEWLGEAGSLTAVQPVAFSGVLVAPVWAHALSVINAKAVDIAAYLSNAGGDPTVDIAASGDIRASLTLSDVGVVSAIPETPDASPVTGALDIKSIVSTAGNVEITLPEALRLSYTADGVGYVVVVPGVFTLSSETVESEGEATISIADMANLLAGENEETKSYALPNGTVIYLTNDRISRIETKDGQGFDAAGIAFDAENQVLTIEPGVTLNLTTGVLSVAEGYEGSFAAYVDYENGEYGLDTQPTEVSAKDILDRLSGGTVDTSTLELWYTDSSNGDDKYCWVSQTNHDYVVKMTKGENDIYSVTAVMAVVKDGIVPVQTGEPNQWEVSLGDNTAVIKVTPDAVSGNYTTTIFDGTTEHAVTLDSATKAYCLENPASAPAWLRGLELAYQVVQGDTMSLANVRCKQLGAPLTAALAYTYGAKTYTVTPANVGTDQQCAIIALQAGDSIALKKGVDGSYRAGETLRVSDGAVITDSASGVQFNAATGTASKAGEFATSASDGILTEVTLPAGQQMPLVPLSDEVYRSFDGKFYKRAGDVFTQLTSAETNGVTTVSDGSITMLTISDEDGVTAHGVYKNGTLAFTVYSDGQILLAGESAASRTTLADNDSVYHLGEIAGDAVTITMLGTAGSIENTETGADAVNITAEDDLTVIMQSTGHFGSGTQSVALSVGGELIFKKPGGTDNTVAIDTNIEDASGEGLTLASGTTILSDMNMQSEGLLTVSDVTIGDNDTTGSLTLSGVGGVTASDIDLQNGDLTLASQGDIAVDGLGANNKPSNLTITSDGDVMVENSDVSSVPALTIAGDDVSITGNTGDVHVGDINAAGALHIETTGNVADASGGNAAAAQTLQNAQARVDDLLVELNAAETALKDAEEEKRKADEALIELQEQYDHATDSQKLLMAGALAAAQDEANQAAQSATQKKTERDEKLAALEQAKQDMASLPAVPSATIAADSVTIQAGGDVGTAGAPLVIESTGSLGITSDADVNAFVAGDATIDHIDASSVQLGAAGDISGADAGAAITADKVSLQSLAGSIGAQDAPLVIDGKEGITASAGDIFLRSEGNAVFGNLIARGTEDGVPGAATGTIGIWSDRDIIRMPGAAFLYGAMRVVMFANGGLAGTGDTKRADTEWVVLKDEPTGVSVAGYLSGDATLSVTSSETQEAWSQALEASMDSDVLLNAWQLESRIAAYTITVKGELAGNLTVRLPMNGSLVGKVVYVLCSVGGQLVVYLCRVVNGEIVFTAGSKELMLLVFTDRQELAEYLAGQGVDAKWVELPGESDI